MDTLVVHVHAIEVLVYLVCSALSQKHGHIAHLNHKNNYYNYMYKNLHKTKTSNSPNYKVYMYV